MSVRITLRFVTLMLTALILLVATCAPVYLDILEMEPCVLVSANTVFTASVHVLNGAQMLGAQGCYVLVLEWFNFFRTLKSCCISS